MDYEPREGLKTVFVNAYWQDRNGAPTFVNEHWRRPPSRRRSMKT